MRPRTMRLRVNRFAISALILSAGMAERYAYTETGMLVPEFDGIVIPQCKIKT
jgi:hypothetical protein